MTAGASGITYAAPAERVHETARSLGGGRRLVLLAGANDLDALVGYLAALHAGHPVLAVPSMVWLAIASTMNDRIHLDHVLLLNGWFGGDDAHGGYWYVEAIVQILVPLALLLSVPAVRRVERAHRALVPLTVVGAGLAIRFHLVDLPTVEPHDIRPHDIFWIFALGWVAAEARSTAQRMLVSVLVLLTVPGYFGEPAREAFVVAGLLLLLWVPTVRLARPLTRVVGSVAAASLYIYLTHWQVFPPLREHFGPLAALLGAVTTGIAAWTAVRYGTLLARRWRQAEAAGAASAGSLAELSAA